MDHDYIEQSDLVSQYLVGRLAAEERAQFEEHFIDCPVCIDQMKMARNFSRGLRLVMVQPTTQAETVSPKASRWAFLHLVSWKTVAMATSCLLLIALICAILLLSRTGRLRSEAEQAKSASNDWQRRYEEQQQAALLSAQERQKTEQDLRSQMRQLEAELQSEQRLRASETGKAQRGIRPDVNMPIFVFNSERGNDQNPSPNTNEISLPHSPVNFLISVPLEGEAEYKTYRFSIFAGPRPLWRGTGFKPDSYNALRIGLNSKFFPPGSYRLVVEGAAGPQGSGLIGNYPFRVVRSS